MRRRVVAGLASRLAETQTAAMTLQRAEAAAVALRVAAGLAFRRAEALAAAMTLQRAEVVALTAPRTVAAASGREETIWQRARACSPVLAVLLRARSAELLTGLTAELLTAPAAEVLAEHFPERFCELRAAGLRLGWAADFASGS